MQMSYWRFAAMIATSTLVMFGLMYIHTYVWDHAYFSETRAWMALLMGAVMAIIMLGYMLNMYKNRTVNIAIFAGAALAFALTTWLVRSQVTVSGTDFMQAMIPHHSIAILTSTRSGIEDPRVRKLADEIIEAQRKEIAEMNYLIRALEREGVLNTRPGLGVFVAQPGSDLTRRARKERLTALADELFTEAVHLGFSADEVQSLLGERMARFAWPQPVGGD